MAELTRSDGKNFMKGTWARTIKGKTDGLRLQFGAGTKQADGSYLIDGVYDQATTKDDSTFTLRLSIITQPSVKPASVSVSMFQSRGNTYAAAYCLQTNSDAPLRLRGSYLDVRGDGGNYQLEKVVKRPS